VIAPQAKGPLKFVQADIFLAHLTLMKLTHELRVLHGNKFVRPLRKTEMVWKFATKVLCGVNTHD